MKASKLNNVQIVFATKYVKCFAATAEACRRTNASIPTGTFRYMLLNTLLKTATSAVLHPIELF